MAKRKIEPAPAPDIPAPVPTPNQDHVAALEKMRLIYENHLNDQMGHLHNRFVAFIAESRLPLPQVLLILQLLVAQTVKQAEKKYLGE